MERDLDAEARSLPHVCGRWDSEAEPDAVGKQDGDADSKATDRPRAGPSGAGRFLSALHRRVAAALPPAHPGGDLRQDTLAWQGAGGCVPACEPFFAALALVDVCGSVRAAQRLVESAGGAGGSRADAERRGAEALSRALNATFERVLALARRRGGDCLHFLGDALLIVVEAAGEAGLDAACRAAAALALDAVAEAPAADSPSPARAAPALRPASSSPKLRLHVGVSAGRCFALTLGGAGRGAARASPEFCVVGSPLERLAAALRLARPGEVGLAPEVAARTSGTPLGSLFQARGEEGYVVFGDALVPPESDREGPGSSPKPSPQSGRGFAASFRSRLSLRRRVASADESTSLALPRSRTSPSPRVSPRQSVIDTPPTSPGLAGISPGLAGISPGLAGIEPLYPPEIDEDLLPLLPRDVASTLASGGRFATELRIASAAFLSVDGFASCPTDAPEEILEWLHRCVQTVQEAAAATGGTLRSVFCDDKGFCCLLTWGVMGAVHADDPDRACTAALRARDDFAARHLGTVSVGVTTGRVFCGLVGDDARCEYNVLGNTINLASRLMGIARGGVLADPATWEALGGRFAGQALDPVLLKGSERPVVPWRLLSRKGDGAAGSLSGAFSTSLRRMRSSPGESGRSERRAWGEAAQTEPPGLELPSGPSIATPPAPPANPTAVSVAAQLRRSSQSPACLLYGRPEVTEAVVRFVAAARAAEGAAGAGVLFIQGNVGFGKSQLVREAARLADEAGAPCMLLASDHLAAARPYHPIREVLRAAIKAGAEAGGSGAGSGRFRMEEARPAEAAAAAAAAGRRASLIRPDGDRRPRASMILRARSGPSQAAGAAVTAAEARAFLQGLGDDGLASVENGELLERLLNETLHLSASPLSSARPSRRASASTSVVAGIAADPSAGAAERAPAAGNTLRADDIVGLLGAPLNDGSGARRAADFLADLLAAIFVQLRVIVLVDDMHALDTATIRLLHRLASAPACSMLATSRPAAAEVLPAELAALRDGPATARLELPPLGSTGAVGGFAAHALGVPRDGVPDWLAAELADRCQGHPFVLHETLRELRARGTLTVAARRAVVLPDELAAFPVPDTIERLVLGRLDRLPPTPALVLKLCSALGFRWDLGMALYALEGSLPVHDVASALGVLEGEGLLVRSQRLQGVAELHFGQTSVFIAIEKLLGAGELQFVHWRAAKYLEGTAVFRHISSAYKIAGHYFAAGAPELAVPYLDMAAADALEAGAHREALHLAQRALAVREPPVPPSAVERAVGVDAPRLFLARRWEIAARALFALGHPSDALRACEHCLELVRPPRPAPLAASVAFCALLGPPARPRKGKGGPVGEEQAAALQQLAAEAQAGARRPWYAPSSRVPPQLHGAVLAGVLPVYAQLLLHSGDAMLANKYTLLHERLARRTGVGSSEHASACARAHGVLLACGAPAALARAWLRPGDELEAAAAGSGSGEAFIAVAVQRAAGLLLAGDAAAAAAAAGSSVSRARLRGPLQTTAFHALGELLVLRALAAHLSGELAAADSHYRLMIAESRRLGGSIFLMHGLVGWSANRLFAGDRGPDVLEALAEARATSPDPRFLGKTLAVASAVATLQLAMGGLEEAEAEALAAADALRRHRSTPPAAALPLRLLALLNLSEAAGALLLAGRRSAALGAALEEAARALERPAARFALFRAPAALARARQTAARGDASRARALGERAAAEARTRGLRAVEAGALRLLVGLGGGEGPAAAARLAALLSSMGCAPEAKPFAGRPGVCPPSLEGMPRKGSLAGPQEYPPTLVISLFDGLGSPRSSIAT